jgi:hypothetical protein
MSIFIRQPLKSFDKSEKSIDIYRRKLKYHKRKVKNNPQTFCCDHNVKTVGIHGLKVYSHIILPSSLICLRVKDFGWCILIQRTFC